MGAAMALVMLAFMLGMYTNRKANIAILVGSVIAFVSGLYLVRSQYTVDDVAWMKAMIPHHRHRDHDKHARQHYRPACAGTGRWDH